MIKFHFHRNLRHLLLPALLLGLPLSVLNAADYPELEPAQLNWIGERIFTNECNRQPECLTAWNTGEDFPSMGIGHFIWYREGQDSIYRESFPNLLAYLQRHGEDLPGWIIEADYNAPWTDRDQFLAELHEQRLNELRALLSRTIGLQTAFIVERFQASRALLQDHADPAMRAEIDRRFLAVANATPPYGLYALIDYVNFKGEGINTSERYRQQGWGLMQVLEQMPQTTASPLAEFVAAARQVLEKRVENAPSGRNESRWLAGWNARLDTYLPPENEH